MVPYSYFIHPEDQQALDTMKSIPGFEIVVKEIMKVGWEEMLHGVNMASQIRLSDEQLLDIYHRVTRICDKLGIDYPEVYLCMSPYPNAWTYGDTRIYLTLTSALFDYLNDDEIDSVIAHECGHILCHHVLYHTVAQFLAQGAGRLFPKISEPLMLAMYWWERKSELSADRAAAIVCGADTVIRTQLRLSGGQKSLTRDVDVEQWARQAENYDEIRFGSGWNRFLQSIATIENTHPFSAVRVREVLNWSHCEDFAKIRNIVDGKISICPFCHESIDKGWRFCQHCGHEIDVESVNL